eukprot:SAG31_NODE_825_length_11760_cov_5.637767_7_plen_534_part_00
MPNVIAEVKRFAVELANTRGLVDATAKLQLEGGTPVNRLEVETAQLLLRNCVTESRRQEIEIAKRTTQSQLRDLDSSSGRDLEPDTVSEHVYGDGPPFWWRGGLLLPSILWASAWVGTAVANSQVGRGFSLAAAPLCSSTAVVHAFSMLGSGDQRNAAVATPAGSRLVWLHFAVVATPIHSVAAIEAMLAQQWILMVVALLTSVFAVAAFRWLLRMRAALQLQHTANIGHIAAQLLSSGMLVILGELYLAVAGTASVARVQATGEIGVGLIDGTRVDRFLLANAVCGFHLIVLYACYALYSTIKTSPDDPLLSTARIRRVIIGPDSQTPPWYGGTITVLTVTSTMMALALRELLPAQPTSIIDATTAQDALVGTADSLDWIASVVLGTYIGSAGALLYVLARYVRSQRQNTASNSLILSSAQPDDSGPSAQYMPERIMQDDAAEVQPDADHLSEAHSNDGSDSEKKKGSDSDDLEGGRTNYHHWEHWAKLQEWRPHSAASRLDAIARLALEADRLAIAENGIHDAQAHERFQE